VLVASALVAALSLAACGSNGAADPSATTTRPQAQVSSPAPPVYSDPSKPIRVAIGREFVIALPADPRSGLSWQPALPPNRQVLLSIGSAFRNAPHSRNVQQVMLYGGRGYGTATIRLYTKSPRPNAPIQKAATFSVTVFDPHAPSTTTTSSTSTTVAGGGTGTGGTISSTTTFITTTTTAPTTTTTLRSTTTTKAVTTTTAKK
jgi:hypothetical protein